MVWPDYTLGDVLKIFKQGKSHLSLVRDVKDPGDVRKAAGDVGLAAK